MQRPAAFILIAGVLCASVALFAQGRARQQGRAIVEFRSPEVRAVAAYEYSQRHHDRQWLLIEFAVRTTKRVAEARAELRSC
jgi:hypothetical protein